MTRADQLATVADLTPSAPAKYVIGQAVIEMRRLAASNARLLAALEESLPSLERLAVEEARRNKAPTGLPPVTAARERFERASHAIAAAARGEQS